jgi:hypothetical protein
VQDRDYPRPPVTSCTRAPGDCICDPQHRLTGCIDVPVAQPALSTDGLQRIMDVPAIAGFATLYPLDGQFGDSQCYKLRHKVDPALRPSVDLPSLGSNELSARTFLRATRVGSLSTSSGNAKISIMLWSRARWLLVDLRLAAPRMASPPTYNGEQPPSGVDGIA